MLRFINNFQITVIILVFFTGLILFFFCAEDIAEPEEVSVVAFEEEEIFKNPVFAQTEKLRIYWPRYDGIIIAPEDLFLSIDSAFISDKTYYQFVIIANKRIAIYDEQIQNKKDIKGFIKINYDNRKNFTDDENSDILDFPVEKFSAVLGGKIKSEKMENLTPGKYYFCSWGINNYGDIISSSPQFAFWIRE
jgi:hypothetical protein